MTIETNCPQRFGASLDSYEKSLANRNYDTALIAIEEAISCNPYPTLYAHLTACRDTAVAAKVAQEYAESRKWWQPRRMTHASH